MAHGKFITLEGGEGAGKSTQARRLAEYLRGLGHDVVVTREVGGSPSAEEIRELWLGKGEGHWDALTEVLLIMAARREHLARTVWPALERGAWVISDRFVDSTLAYQGVGLGVGVEKIRAIYYEVAGDFMPDLTLLLDVPVDVGMSRVASRRGEDDRYQQRKKPFHETLRAAYLDLAANEPERFRVIDAGLEAWAVAADIGRSVSKRFNLPNI